ncbi:cupin domain-containing protein [Mesorhizobium xinjiangense]|uniref:cupin domain-containing protein n=1 Tax=Mesorhizobium xinjiangense TaxID=2678685 RepID=UPI0012ED3F37|nr:cupin domain-containing protein [Mesorhizobium xinjiangense]
MNKSSNFVRPSEDGWLPADPGVRRRVLAHDEQLMIVEFAFEKDAVGKPHSHPHVQASYVAQGRFEVTVDGETEVLSEGASFVVPSNAVHGVRALEPGRLIDSFTPARGDFL